MILTSLDGKEVLSFISISINNIGPPMESWKKILYISWGVIFFHTAGTGMLMPFLPLYVKELGVTSPQAQSLWSGILYGVTSLSSALMAPLWGTISDKYGRKTLILRTTLGISVVALLMSFATNVYQLFVLRILHGVCAGMLPAFVALVSVKLPRDKTGQGIGTLQSAQFSGQIIGPFIGGLLADLLGYRKVLVVISLLTLIAAAATMLFIHEPQRDRAKPRSSVAGNIKLVLSSGNLRIVAMALFVTQFALYIVQPIFPLYIVSLHGTGNSATMVGLVFAVTGFSTLLFAPARGKAGDKVGHHKVLSRSLLFAGVAFIPQALVALAYQLLPLRAVLGFFVAGIIPSTQTMIVKNTKDSQRGGVLGITHSVSAGGHALGPLVGGLVGALFGYRVAIMLSAALLIALSFILKNYFREKGTRQEITD